MRFSCTEYAIVAHQLIAYRTVYNHPMDAFLLHWICSCQFPRCWPIRRSTIIQGMCFSYTEYAVISLQVIGFSDGLQSFKGCVPLALDMQLSVRLTIIQRMRFFCTEYAIVRLPVVSLLDGLQLSKGCVSPALSMQLSISRSLAYWTVYNHPRDAFLLH